MNSTILDVNFECAKILGQHDIQLQYNHGSAVDSNGRSFCGRDTPKKMVITKNVIENIISHFSWEEILKIKELQATVGSHKTSKLSRLLDEIYRDFRILSMTIRKMKRNYPFLQGN